MLSVEDILQIGEVIAVYEPLAAAHDGFHQSIANTRWMFGGNQSGKSYSLWLDLAMQALDVHPFSFISSETPIHWACIESWEQVRDVIWESYLKQMIPAHLIGDIRFGKDKIPKRLFLTNGHTIEFKAFNQGRTLFQAREIDTCHCDEQCHSDFQGILNEIQARLLKRSGRLSWAMTPVIPQPYLEERIEELPDTDEVFHANLNNNRLSEGGYIKDKRIDEMIDEWPEEVQTTRIEGRFASFYGAVYKTWNRSVHFIKPFPIPEGWQKYRGIDFGFTNPFVCLWVAKDGDNNWYVFREYYKAKTGINEHIRNVKKLSKPTEKYICTYADPENAEDRAEMKKQGLPTKIARKDVAKGIELVQSKLKVKRNGKPSLYVFNTCRNTAREMAIYRYPEGSSSKNPKDVPVSKDDHTVDTLRYILYTTEKPGKKGKVYAA